MTEQVERVLLKPLSLTEKAMTWLIQYVEHLAHKKEHHKHKPVHHAHAEAKEEK
jgi:hypothetical protein